MNSTTICPRCGAEHPAAIAGGLCPHCLLAGLLDAETEPRIGEREGDAVGPYELVEHIADGGMGSVWRARQLHPVEREVALKIVKHGMDTRELVSRFESERQSLAMMDHPGIARVFEAGATDSGRPYFAMELVEGEPVTDYCVSRKLPVEERLRLFMEICAAVAHAHRKGVLHRDIKPSNVMVVERAAGPQVKVIDFGIAKLLETENDGRTFATLAGHAIGTPGYMSPEQAGAEPDVDTRSDVYSLGALLYEMLTGSPPLGSKTFHEVTYAEVMRIIRETDPPRPSTRLGPAARTGTPPPLHIARDLDRIVMKALARERDRRYGGVYSLGEDVRRFLEHEPVTATDPTLAYHISRFVRRHRLAVSLVFGIVLALLAGLVTTRREADRARMAAANAQAARLETLSTLADSYRDKGIERSLDREFGQAALWFTMAHETASHDTRRSEANLFRAILHQESAPIAVGFLKRERMRGRLVFDETSSYLHESELGREHAFFDLDSGSMLDFGGPLIAGTFLPGANRVAVSKGDERVEIRDPGDLSVEESFDVPGESVTSLWPDESGGLLLAGQSRPRVWNRRTKRFVGGPLVHPEPVGFAAFAPDGTRVLTVDLNEDLRVFDLDQGGPEPFFGPVKTSGVTANHLSSYLPTFVGDADHIRFKQAEAVPRKGGKVQVVDLTTGMPTEVWEGSELAEDVSPDGSLFCSYFGVFSVPDGAPAFRRTVGNTEFLPDRSGVYGNGSGEILNLAGERLNKVAVRDGTTAISPDGSLLASRHEAGIAIYQLVRPQPFLRIHAPFAGRIALSDDQRLIASAGWSDLTPVSTTTRAYRLEDGLPAGPLIDTGYQNTSGAFVPGSTEFLTGGRETDVTHADSEAWMDVGGVLQTWEIASGDRLAGPLALPSWPCVVLTHPVEPWIAVLCINGDILRVDRKLGSFETIARLGKSWVSMPFGRRPTGFLEFSPEGRTLYASGLDHRTSAIDVATGEMKFPAIEQNGRSLSLDVHGGVIFAPTQHIDPVNADPWIFDARTGDPFSIDYKFKFFLPVGSRLAPDGGEILISSLDRALVVNWKRGQSTGPPFRTANSLCWAFSEFVKGTPWVLTATATKLEPASMRLWDTRSGEALSPPWPLTSIELGDFIATPDGRHAILSQPSAGFMIVKLDEVREMAARPSDLSRADRRRFAEIQAGRRFREGRSAPLDGPGHWGPMLMDFVERHPLREPLKPDRDVLLRWHRNQEAFHGPESFPGKWHRQRVETLEAEK